MNAREILALLPPFDARTRRRAAEAVAARLAAGASLVEAATSALDERDGLVKRHATAAAEWFTACAGDRAGATADLFHAAWGRAPDRRERRAMAHGRLGPEALAERAAAAAARLEAQVRVAFLAAHAIALRTGALDAHLAALSVRLAADAAWRLARPALDALSEHAAAGRSPPAAAVERARRLAGESSAPVWSRVAAVGLLAAALGPGAAEVLEASLPGEDARTGRAAGGDGDLFVRCSAARALARVDAPRAREILPRLAEDPSEHVRMELAPLLAAVGAAEALRALADPSRERSPRVRAAAAIALAEAEPPALVAILESDPDDVPRRAALEEAERIASSHPALRQAVDALAVGGAGPELTRLAAEAAERLHHRLDPAAAAALSAASAVRSLPEGGAAQLDAAVDAEALGRALAVLSTGDLPLAAARSGRGWELTRGDRMRRRLWRALHEVRHPSPDKRQGQLHTIARTVRAEVRAPPGGLAEVTATKVPGERVVVPGLGDWGRHLPMVEDLLSRPPSGEARIFSAFGSTRILWPTGSRWTRARARLTLGYAGYARMREQSLAGAELRERRAYLATLRGLGFEIAFAPHRAGGPAEVLAFYEGAGAASAPRASGLAAAAPAADLLRAWLDPAASSVNHLAAAAFLAAGFFVLRLHEARRDIDRARADVPLSVGGWGTRGKSGTERLKAALFQALGCEVLVKTTGCEAMFIHAVPEVPACEVFIYRAYDKATVWEQRDLLRLAARLGVDVFLWECMALGPELVELLQQGWMRDDLATLTNAYPDHENLQGPAGIDIPRVMARFVPRGRLFLTAEEQMLPILREAAAEGGAELVHVEWRDHALLPQDLLDRFPYDEHPRNVALSLKLAAALGVDRETALKEMADWLIPDLGALKTYPEARWRGRRLIFSNGMSANERAAFQSNWTRLGLDRHRADDVGEWVVTVVNNRADRVSRSMVFADVLVEDAAANAHVLIGTNLEGLYGFIDSSLRRAASAIALFHADEESLPPEENERLALARAERALARVKIGALGAERFAAEAEAISAGLGAELGAALPEALVAALTLGEPSLAATRKALAPMVAVLTEWVAPLGDHAPDAARHLLDLAARHAAVLRWRHDLAAACSGDAADRRSCEAAFRALYREIFLEGIVVLRDPALSGDQVVDAVARACPPGFRVRILGVQNIKGAGLDFAYRWVAYDRTVRALRELSVSRGEEAVRIARALVTADDSGVLDFSAAEEGVRAATAREEGAAARDLEAAAQLLAGRRAASEGALETNGRAGTAGLVTAAERVLDVWDGVLRRWRADRTIDDLVAGRVSHERAAKELRDLMKRQKGGWLLGRS